MFLTLSDKSVYYLRREIGVGAGRSGLKSQDEAEVGYSVLGGGGLTREADTGREKGSGQANTRENGVKCTQNKTSITLSSYIKIEYSPLALVTSVFHAR